MHFHPGLLQEWAEQNDKNLTDYTPGSHFQAFWQCKKGHVWQASIKSRSAGSGCPVCSGRIPHVGVNDLATTHPHLAVEWDIEKNTLLPHEVSAGSTKKVFWQCKKAHSWQAAVSDRSKGSGCPVCSGRIANVGVSDLATTHPHLAAEWDIEKNNLLSSEVSAGSGKKVWWRCKKGHSWQAAIKRRASGTGCPVCSGRIPNVGVTDLATTHPDILTEWDFKKNTLLPSQVSAGSNKKVWWRCKEGHHWSKAIALVVKGSGCPTCLQNQKVQNCLVKKYPQLALEWDYSRNSHINIEQISASSAKRVWWKCAQGHSWQTYVYSRTGNNASACPECSLQNPSKAEIHLREFVFSLGLDAEYNKKDIPGVSEVDIYIPSKKIAIEYNGLYWHTERQGKGINYHFDKWKNCRDQGIFLIQVWEDEWISKPEIVKSMLAHKLGVSKQSKVYARKTVVQVVDKEMAFVFLEENHIQGYGKGFIRYGLFAKQTNELVACAVFKKRNQSDIELVRYASKYQVVGGLSKLIANVKKEHPDFEQMITFANHCVSDGNIYEVLGFQAVKILRADYSYLVDKQRVHKFNYRKQRFQSDSELEWKPEMSGRELATLNNLDRIWDAGKTKYTLSLKEIYT